MTDKEKQQFFNSLVEKMGTTPHWTATGFILPDGTMLNFSNTDIYPDPAVAVYTHEDLEKFFGYKQEDVLKYGGIRVGYCDANDKPFIQILFKDCEPTDFQWTKIDELLHTDTGELDVEANTILNNDSTAFYKKYVASTNTIDDIKDDLDAYLDGDTTNLGTYSEKLGIKDSN